MIEVISAVLLSVAAVATAWSSYQAARWQGEQAKAQSKATATRLESTRASGVANRQAIVDVELFTQWVDAHARGERKLDAFYRERFTERFKPAFVAWIATKPFERPQAPKSPFEMRAYRLASQTQAAALEAKAEAFSAKARTDIQRANNYVLAVVLFAASLFFAGISTKLNLEGVRLAVLAVGCTIFLGTVVWVATSPVSIAV